MEVINYNNLSINLSTNELIDSVLKIDNGYMDNWCEKTNKFEYCEEMRYNLIDELLRRYLDQSYIGESKDLERAYKLFLRFYV
jgi:hypothetical protein